MAGGWPSQWTSFNILRKLGKEINCQRLVHLRPMEPWSGGDYLFRLNGRGFWGNVMDFSIAFMVVFVAFLYSFWMSWKTPTVGLGCRGLAEIGFLAGWLLSAISTLSLRAWVGRENQEFLVWKCVWIKNGFLAVISFSMLLLPFLGTSTQCNQLNTLANIF